MYLERAPRIDKRGYNHGQKSRDKFALLELLHTRQTLMQLRLPNLAPTPHTMFKTSICNIT